MHGLTVDFELKRKSKLNKAMNLLLILAFAIFAGIAFIYIPYLGKQSELIDKIEEKSLVKQRYDRENGNKVISQASSAEEQAYSDDYEILKDSQYDFKSKIDDINDIFNMPNYSVLKIRRMVFNGTEKTITFNCKYDLEITTSQIDSLSFQLGNEFVKAWPTTRFSFVTNSSDGSYQTEMELTVYYGDN